jgi:amidohydrolase
MISEKMTPISEERFQQMVDYRRHLHKNPEISYHEFETTAFIVSELEKLHCEVIRPLETGCLAVFKSTVPSKRVVAIRADIDALRMTEYGDAKKDFMSTRENAAHCCGHDIHTANLLGLAHELNDRLSMLEGTVVLIFQPGEEKLPGGGKLLMEEGSLQRLGIQRIYGLHTYPHANPGHVLTKVGELMASPDEIEIVFTGVGGHAAAPHRTIDTIVMASAYVSALQSIVSRNVDPTEKAVVTIGSFHGGSAHNVIPEKVELKGTIRSFSRETANLLSSRAKELAEGIAKAYGGTAEFTYTQGYPPVINDATVTNQFFTLAKEEMGEDQVQELARPIMAGEDFAFYQQEFPGCFFFLGSGSEKEDARWEWHHPKYNVDEECLKTASKIMLKLALNG